MIGLELKQKAEEHVEKIQRRGEEKRRERGKEMKRKERRK